MRLKWKSLLALLTVTCLLATLVACGGSSSSSAPASTAAPPAEASTPAADSTAEPAPEGEVVSLRLATSVQPDHPMNLAALRFAELVKEKSNGRIEITVYPARQLGDDREVAEQVIQGSLDMVEISAIIFTSYSDLPNAWQIPFLFSDWEQYRSVVKSDENKALLAGMDAMGVKALTIYNTGFRHVATANKDVLTVEDMKNLKIRVGEPQLFLDIFTALGAAPTPMAYGEVYSGLQNRVVDATEADYCSIYLEKYMEVCKSVTETKHFGWPGLLCMNMERFNAFSAEDQQLIMDAAWEAVDFNVDNIIETETYYEDLLLEEGLTINKLSDEEFKRFQDAVADVRDKYSNMDPLIADFVNLVMANA